MPLKSPALELPDYTVRVSPKAKHLRLKLSANKGLVVVVPKEFDQSRIPALLESRRPWLEKHLERIGENRRFLAEEPADVLPEVVLLNAIGERWAVAYKAADRPTVAAQIDNRGILYVTGRVGNRSACRDALRRWLSRMTHLRLVPWLERLSDQTGLSYDRVMVKGQRTRWASCSHHKTISINYKLLFLPERLVRYVFLHELCHTLEMNHSRRYWKLLSQYESRCQELHEQTREAWKHVPVWVGQP